MYFMNVLNKVIPRIVFEVGNYTLPYFGRMNFFFLNGWYTRTCVIKIAAKKIPNFHTQEKCVFSGWGHIFCYIIIMQFQV